MNDKNSVEETNLVNLIIMPYMSGSGGSSASRTFEYYGWYTEEISSMSLIESTHVLIQSNAQNSLLRFPIRGIVLLGEEEGLSSLERSLQELQNMQADGRLRLRIFLLKTESQVLRARYLEHRAGISPFKHPLEAKGLGFSMETAIESEARIAERLPAIIDNYDIDLRIIDTSFHGEQSLRDRMQDYIAPDRPLLIDQDEIAFMKQVNERVRLFSELPLSEPFLITGGVGTGKRMLAQAIHNATLKKAGADGFENEFHIVDCNQLRDIYMDDLWNIRNGTLFFNGIERLGNRDLRIQNSIQEKLRDKIAGKDMEWSKIRIVAASNLTREDLFSKRGLREMASLFRMSIDTLPLREQGSGEIAKYIRFILNEIEQREDFKVKLEKSAQDRLEKYEWPGNIAEMREVLEMSVRNSWALGDDEKKWEPQKRPSSVYIQNKHIDLQRFVLPEANEFSNLLVVPEDYNDFKEQKKILELTLKEKFIQKFERDFYESWLTKVRRKSELAEHLGIPAQNLYRKLKELNIG